MRNNELGGGSVHVIARQIRVCFRTVPVVQVGVTFRTMETVKGQLSVYPVNTTNYCVLNEDSGSSFLWKRAGSARDAEFDGNKLTRYFTGISVETRPM